MDISSELRQLTGPVEKAIANFNEHANVNRLIESLNRQLTAFIEKLVADGSKCDDFLPIYDVTMGDIDQVFELIEKYLRELDVTTAEHVIFCADGARRYWKRIDPLAKKLGIAVHFEVIDYTHAKQNLATIIEKLPKALGSKQTTNVAKQWDDLLWKGDLHEIKRQIMQMIKSRTKRKRALAKFKSYFLDNFHRMQYAGFRYFNVTTGSGCVESAIRRVINLRLKSPGIFWKRETAEVMLFLRSTLLLRTLEPYVQQPVR